MLIMYGAANSNQNFWGSGMVKVVANRRPSSSGSGSFRLVLWAKLYTLQLWPTKKNSELISVSVQRVFRCGVIINYPSFLLYQVRAANRSTVWIFLLLIHFPTEK